MADVEREYPYRPRWTTVFFCAAFFTLGAVVLGAKAARNDRGLIVAGLLEFGPEGATVFYWVLAACGAGFVVLAAVLAYHRLAYRQRVALGPDGLIVPASRWSGGETEIAYRDIRGLSTARVAGQRFLYVDHPGGRYTMTASLLPSRAVFDEIRDVLAAKVRAAQGIAGRPA